MARVCLVTAFQPASNPRLVKEADALAEAGHDVHVVAGHYAEWADAGDQDLFRSRTWTCSYVGGEIGSLKYWQTRYRLALSRRALGFLGAPWLDLRAVSRLSPELARAARKQQADLYIAHNLGALPAAVAAARSHSAVVGYDVEDFLPGSVQPGAPSSVEDAVIQRIENRYLPRCDYLTAASAGIANGYRARYGVSDPTVVLNVFPLADRAGIESPRVAGDGLSLYWFSQTIGPDRGLQDIVRAMGLAGDRRLRLHLRGTWQRGFERQLFALARDVSLAPDQIQVHEPAPSGDMIRLSACHDIGLALEQPVSVNRDVCLTNKIFTYLLAGNAVIGTETSGQLPVLQDLGCAARSYRPGDVHALAAHLQFWLQHRDELLAARRRAWECGSRRYNWDLEKRAFLRVVEGALERT